MTLPALWHRVPDIDRGDEEGDVAVVLYIIRFAPDPDRHGIAGALAHIISGPLEKEGLRHRRGKIRDRYL